MFLHKLSDSSWINSYAIFFNQQNPQLSLFEVHILYQPAYSEPVPVLLPEIHIFVGNLPICGSLQSLIMHCHAGCIILVEAWRTFSSNLVLFWGMLSTSLLSEIHSFVSYGAQQSLSFWWLPPGKQTVCYRASPFLNRSVNINQLSMEVFSTGNCQSLPAGKAKPGL